MVTPQFHPVHDHQCTYEQHPLQDKGAEEEGICANNCKASAEDSRPPTRMDIRIIRKKLCPDSHASQESTPTRSRQRGPILRSALQDRGFRYAGDTGQEPRKSP